MISGSMFPPHSDSTIPWLRISDCPREITDQAETSGFQNASQGGSAKKSISSSAHLKLAPQHQRSPLNVASCQINHHL